MRKLALVLVLLAGCGEAEEPAGAPSLPAELTTLGSTPLPLGEPAPVREREVPEGETAVLGLDGRAQARPERLAIAEDAELSRITWDEWSPAGAEGQGNLRLLECRPNCAQGTPKVVGATIRLSQAKDCPDGPYFDRAVVEIPGRDPMSFIQAPC